MAEATSPASIASTEAAEIHADWLDSKASLFDPRVRQRIALSAGVSAPVYIRMMRKRVALAAAMADALAPIDVLALPTTPVTAPKTAPLVADDALYFRTNLLLLRNTMVANQFDLASVSLPLQAASGPWDSCWSRRTGTTESSWRWRRASSSVRQPVKAAALHQAHATGSLLFRRGPAAHDAGRRGRGSISSRILASFEVFD